MVVTSSLSFPVQSVVIVVVVMVVDVELWEITNKVIMWFGVWNVLELFRSSSFPFIILTTTFTTIAMIVTGDDGPPHWGALVSPFYSLFRFKFINYELPLTRHQVPSIRWRVIITANATLDWLNSIQLSQNDDDRCSRRNGNGNYDDRAWDVDASRVLAGTSSFLYFIYSTK